MLRATFFGMILAWVVSLAAHVSFRRRLSSEALQALPLRSPFGIAGSVVGLSVVCAVVLKGWWDSRVNSVSAIFYLIFFTLAWWMIRIKRRQGNHP
jgi:L-asparagine transporter-like permease